MVGSSASTFYNRATKREIKRKLKRLGVIKPNIAEFLIKDIYGDSSMPNDKNQREILSRLEVYVSTGDDIAVDLRENNGAIPKFDEFWKIVAEYIEDKTAVDDRRHSVSSGDGDIVVNMGLALSYAELWRTCVEIAKKMDYDINLPCLALSHPMPAGGGETLTKFELQIPLSLIAVRRSAPVRPVSSSMIALSVTYGRPTLLFASGDQSSSLPAGSP